MSFSIKHLHPLSMDEDAFSVMGYEQSQNELMNTGRYDVLGGIYT